MLGTVRNGGQDHRVTVEFTDPLIVELAAPAISRGLTVVERAYRGCCRLPNRCRNSSGKADHHAGDDSYR